jgi:ADP-heptose:LPS heptosyltransferase
MNQSNNPWKQDIPERPKYKELTEPIVKKLGLKMENVKIVDTLTDLRNNPPNIVIAECIKTISFVQNWFKHQTLKKKYKYVMGLGVYQQLFFDLKRNVKVLRPAGIKFKNIYKPYLGEDLTNKTLLVSRTGGIGDLCFVQPNLIYLKEKYPTCTINFACGPQYQAMVETWDCVDRVLDLPFHASYLFKSDYQAIFEGVVERCREAETTNAYNLFSRWLGLDLPDELLLPKQKPKEDKITSCKEIMEEWGIKDKPILLQLRASSPIRCPRIEIWTDIIDRLTDKGYVIAITDSPRQAEGVDAFIKTVKQQDKVFNFCKHSETLDYTIAMTALSKGVVSTDSALLHIAASLEIPAFGLYGPFPGEIRLKTYPLVDWIDAKRSCAPCYQHGMKPCKHAGSGDPFSPCYDNIDIGDTVERIEKIIQKEI